jgi:hypothetical protein
MKHVSGSTEIDFMVRGSLTGFNVRKVVSDDINFRDIVWKNVALFLVAGHPSNIESNILKACGVENLSKKIAVCSKNGKISAFVVLVAVAFIIGNKIDAAVFRSEGNRNKNTIKFSPGNRLDFTREIAINCSKQGSSAFALAIRREHDNTTSNPSQRRVGGKLASRGITIYGSTPRL